MERAMVEKTASRGIVIAPVYKFLEPDLSPEGAGISADADSQEQKKFEDARSAVMQDLEELAGDPKAVPVLLEMGPDEFSMSAGSIDYVREQIITGK